jgi:hypothetical protein
MFRFEKTRAGIYPARLEFFSVRGEEDNHQQKNEEEEIEDSFKIQF